ncbi:MAG TPA: tRNA modification GTPase [Pirellulales bacterium]|jgi:tRNA modification GTPase|nr:tRNA modification GTPase [Pirellulales bacterium]
MLYDLRDTIVAVASAPGGAARGIVRLSGPRVVTLIAAAFNGLGSAENLAALGAAVHRGSLRLTHWNRDLPALVYLWPTERSYTRQPAAELHIIGSPGLLSAAVDELCRHGARPAAPGEFTLRAFLVGRIDLTQAEAVLGVIDAQGEQQLVAALAQLAGGLADPLFRLRESLLDLLARLEAGLDFSTEDIEFITASEITCQLAAATGQIERIAAQIGSRGESADVVRVALVGRPNAGKSSLFNALAGAQAIVSDEPGTTRDYLTARLDFGGVACELIDTAGVQSGGDALVPEAQRQSRAQAERAQITLLCLDGSVSPDDLRRDLLAAAENRAQTVVLTKHDLSGLPGGEIATEFYQLATVTVETSVRTGRGLDTLRRRIAELARGVAIGDGSSVAATAARAAHSVRAAADALCRARALNDRHEGEELIAAELRLALDELGKVSGAVTTDDVLDRIFSRFCIGK